MQEEEIGSVDWHIMKLEQEVKALRHRLLQVCLAITNPDRDHIDRCVDVLAIVGSAEDWR